MAFPLGNGSFFPSRQLIALRQNGYTKKMISSSTKKTVALILALASILTMRPPLALAHASGQGFVLLLPTDFYIATGIATVVLTAATLVILPTSIINNLFVRWQFSNPLHVPRWLQDFTSLMALALLVCLLVVGITGSSDPLSNPFTLVFWTVWWTMLLFLTGVLGDFWKWVNPWTGLYRILFGDQFDGFIPLPKQSTMVLGITGLIVFSAFALADIAPDYPPRLAIFVANYWVFTFIGMCVFGGKTWLSNCECFTILFYLFAKISPVRLEDQRGHLGVPGWKIVTTSPHLLLAVFCLTALAVGSFDGLNETFLWLALIGVNPLEFPGRSAVAAETVGGIIGAVFLLHICFALVVWMGDKLASQLVHQQVPQPSFVTAFGRFSLSVLPIALGYHFAHFLPDFLVNSQYLMASLSDPLTTGADLLGLGTFYVTTGFFYHQETVRTILLTQCAAIVLGHMIAVLVAHAIALDIYRSNKAAILSQIPMAIFMASYTFLSLWLLASPRGA